VVLPHVLDVKTLLICSTLSQQSQQAVQDAVRLNLAPLVKQLAYLAGGRCSTWRLEPQPHVEAWQLLWLCSTAGPAAVNAYENACAILQALCRLPAALISDAEQSQGEL
jgi:hypothetical protein